MAFYHNPNSTWTGTQLSEQQAPVCPNRPARVQIEEKIKLQRAENQGDYNIWYHKYLGDREYVRNGKAMTRCNLELDAGLTKADYQNPDTAYICLHWARGACVYGKECTFLHRAPTDADESSNDSPKDVFGRDRHGNFRDDMGGVGSWSKECKTLYVGCIHCQGSEEEIEETVFRHFSEWGVIDYIRVLTKKGCAFVRFQLRCAAEMAKEAMDNQGMDHDEQLNLRWAHEDPNPKAITAKLRHNAQLVINAMESRGQLPPDQDEFYKDTPDAKRARLMAEGGEAPPGIAMPQAAEDKAAKFAPLSREDMERIAQEQEEKKEAERRAKEEAAAKAAAAKAAQDQKQEQAAAVSRLDAILGKIGGEGDSEEPGESYGDFMQRLTSEQDAEREQEQEANTQEEPGSALDRIGLPPGINYAARAAAQAGGTPTASASAPHLPGLPPNWYAYTDPRTYQPYYYNHLTGQSSWTMPTM